MKSCDRCDDIFDNDDECIEFQFGAGIMAYLCYKCRQEWMNKIVDLKCFDLICELERATISIEYKMEHDDQEEEILKILDRKHQAERKLRSIAKAWLQRVGEIDESS